MIVTKHRQMYYKQKGSGIGLVNKEIYGNGIFTDTMKMLGKKGISIAEIAKITGVSITELKRLKDKKH